MFSPFEVETLARLQREEVARQVAAVRRAQEATRGAATNRPLRRRLATALRAMATRLAPAAGEPVAGAEPTVT